MRNLLIAVGVFGSLGLAGSALAKPLHDNDASPPPGTFRSEFSLRMSSDGRADLHADRARQDRYDVSVTRPAPDRDYGQAKHEPLLGLKAEAVLRMQNGDNREGGSSRAKQAVSASRSVDANRFGREQKPPPVQLKLEVVMKMQHGDNREGSNKSLAASARNTNEVHQTLGHRQGLPTPLSSVEKADLCRHTGICLVDLALRDNSDTR